MEDQNRGDLEIRNKHTQSLSLAELFKIAVDLGKFVSGVWGLYVTIITAVVGWLVAVKTPPIPIQTRWIVSVLIFLLTLSFCFVIEFQHEKIRQIYALIRSHPELKEADSSFSEAVASFAAPFTGLTNRIFLPIAGVLLVILVWLI